MKRLPFMILSAFILALGIAIGMTISPVLAGDDPKPAYVVVSGTLEEDADLTAYREKAGPIAEKAGIKILARQDITLLEGEWPHPKQVTIEKFESMEALKAFWYSDEYQEAIKLREGKFKADFIIALEGS